MKNATIGYPRIGEFRELKFAVEKYGLSLFTMGKQVNSLLWLL